ncbi:hypothetical protein QFZ52_002221 [Arthrobacter woluwensis]|nr:hypothetical protein [Arthrobacter woluwensis]
MGLTVDSSYTEARERRGSRRWGNPLCGQTGMLPGSVRGESPLWKAPGSAGQLPLLAGAAAGAEELEAVEDAEEAAGTVLCEEEPRESVR